jgi:ABC-2 type transport system permease protein
LAEILHILRYKLLAFLKMNVDWSFESVLKNIGSFLVYTGFMLGTYFLTYNVIAFLLEQANIGVFLLHRFLSMALYVFFLSINVGNIIVSYSTLYKSSEVSYLLTKPVSFAGLFVIKFLDNFFYSSTTLFVIGFSVLAGYGTYFNLPWTFYVEAVFFLFIPFMLLAAVIGVMMLMGLIKLAQLFGPRPVITTLTLGYVGSIYVFFKTTNPMKLVQEVMRFYPNIDQYFGFLDPPVSRFLPNHWVAESLYWTVSNNGADATVYMGILIGACLIVFGLALLIARKWYYRSWLAFLDLRLQREYHSPSRVTSWLHFSSHSPLETQTEMVLKKEFWQFFREPSQWIHLCVILLLMGIFLASMRNIEAIPGNPFLQSVAFLVVFLFNTFLISSIALRFVYPLMSIEGEAFWKVRSAPVSLKKIALIKFSLALLLTLIIGQFLNGFSKPLTTSSLLSTVSSINAAFVVLAMVTLCFGMGSLFVTYKEKNPIRIASSQGASLTFLLTLIYMVFLVGILFIPLQQYFEMSTLGKPFLSSSFMSVTVVIGLLSVIISTVAYLMSVQSLEKDF